MKIGYAIVLKGNTFEDGTCYTSAPEILGGGSLWQVYRTRADAKRFLKVPFGDAEYEIVEVQISSRAEDARSKSNDPT